MFTLKPILSFCINLRSFLGEDPKVNNLQAPQNLPLAVDLSTHRGRSPLFCSLQGFVKSVTLFL
jgi:hypothetical protein